MSYNIIIGGVLTGLYIAKVLEKKVLKILF